MTVLVLFVATLVYGVFLGLAFEPDVQTIGAAELVERRDDARAFLIADYVFVLLYAVLSPMALWRFGSALDAGWIRLAALVLAAAGLVDAAENTLLISSTGSVSEARVDAAHALEIPKIALFTVGALLALAANVRAVGVLRER